MSPAAAVRLLLADVDGTLVTNDRVLTGRAIQAVQALGRADVGFALTSSRPPRGLAKFVEPLGLILPLAGLNGGILVNPDLSVIEAHRLSPAIARSVVRILKANGVDIWIYTDADWFVPKADGAHVSRETWILGFEPTVVHTFDDAELSGAIKIVGVSDDHGRVASAEAALGRELGAGVNAARSEPHFVDVTSPDANKGLAAIAFARRLNLRREEIATIGDMPNDVFGFKQSGLSIAMGNASAEVQAAATEVTSSNEEEGFAKAVERLLRDRDRSPSDDQGDVAAQSARYNAS